MITWRSVIVFSFAFWNLTDPSARCWAQSITGHVLLSNPEGIVQGDVPEAWVVVCRENSILKKQEKLLDKARFDVPKEADGRTFDVVVGAADMTPATLRGLAIGPGEKLVLSITLQRMSETLRAPTAGRRFLDRKVADALDVLPSNSDQARSILDSVKKLGETRPVSILLPAYFYPGGETAKEWDAVIQAASELRNAAELVVIVNVQSGPGNPQNPDANYLDVIARVAKAGAKTVGYVNGDYGKRSARDVERDVSAWIKAYPRINGIYFDQVSSGKEDVAHFKGLCEYARKAFKNTKQPLIVGNSGTASDEGYVGKGGFDMLCISENSWGKHKIEKPRWEGDDSRSKLGAIIYGVVNKKDFDSAFDLVTSEGLDFLYISDQTGVGEVLWTRTPNRAEIWRPLIQRTKDWNKAARDTKK